MNFSEGEGNEVLLIGNVNSAVGQKCHLALIQVHVHELVCSLGEKGPSDHILSFRDRNFRKWFKCISCSKPLFFWIMLDV